MATNNQINVGLSGVSGTGSLAGSTSATFVTPTLGAATGTSLAFSPTTGGIVGTTTNDAAAAGVVGEYISSSVLVGSAVSLTSTIAANVTSIALSAGDWDVVGSVQFSPNGATTSTSFAMGINSTSATLPTNGSGNNKALTSGVALGAGAWVTQCTGAQRFNVSGATTVYLVVSATFAVNTLAAYGFISARRVR